MEENKLLQVFFAIGGFPLTKGQVVIKPMESELSWNDFGYQIKCMFKACVSNELSLIEGELLIGFIAPLETSKPEQDEFYKLRPTLSKLMNKQEETIVNSERFPPFFTLLPDLNSYRNIVESLSPKGAEVFLRSVNDLVIYKDTRNSWIDRALGTDVFNRGFMRNSEPFFAFNNASSVLGGMKEESFSAISKSLDLSFTLEGFRNTHEISLRYSHHGLIPRRINVLIGKNGLGKSQALKYFCRAALRYQDSNLSLVDVDTAINQSRPMISRVLAIATPGETQNTFPVEQKKSQKLFYRRLNLTRNSKSKLSRSIGEALVQLARSEEHIGANSRWELFLGALQKSFATDSLVIVLKDGECIPIEVFSKGGEQAKLDRWGNVDPKVEPQLKILDNRYPLSSGQLTFFKFALLCCLYIENGSFVLMDEPETHLHPNLISDFVELLDYLLEHTGSQALIATHSAYFVREVPKEQVHVFQQQADGGISIDQPRLRTFGATVDSISQFVFGENAEIRLTDRIYEKVKTQSFESVDEELGDQLSLAALMHLRRRMEDE